MTRILFWNVNKVGTNSLFPQPGARPRIGNEEGEWAGEGQHQAVQDGEDRLDVLIGVINSVAPHIVSIAEVAKGKPAPAEGTPVNDEAMMNLLGELQERTEFEDWRLVPPLTVGQGGVREGVAVFYRDTGLRFLGPWGWSGAIADDRANLEALAPYGGTWAGALPERMIGAGWPGIENANESTLAAQWRYEDAEENRINFPLAGKRGPLLTMFGEPGFPAGPRVIKLLSFHAPPRQIAVGGAVAESAAGTAALAQIREMQGEIAALEVRCIAGDFNVSAWVDGIDAASYAPLRALNFIQHLNPRGRATPGVEPPPAVAYAWPAAGYYATHSRAVNAFEADKGANPWVSYGEANTIQGYPGFGWASRQEGNRRYDAIDGIFTRHGAEAGAAAAFTIANPITGSPYNAPEVEVPPNVAVGAIAIPSEMWTPGVFALPAGVPEINEEEEDDTAVGEAAQASFSNWDNFPKIRSLSDHLPVVIDV